MISNWLKRLKNLWKLSEYEPATIVYKNAAVGLTTEPFLKKTVVTMQRKPATIIDLNPPEDGIANEPQSN